MSIPDATLVFEIAQNLKENFPLRDPIRWEWAHRDEGGMVIIPSKPSEYLYRGQSARYTPCLPEIARTFEFTGPSVYGLRRRDKLILLKQLAASVFSTFIKLTSNGFCRYLISPLKPAIASGIPFARAGEIALLQGVDMRG